jgi:hypothetical protein
MDVQSQAMSGLTPDTHYSVRAATVFEGDPDWDNATETDFTTLSSDGGGGEGGSTVVPYWRGRFGQNFTTRKSYTVDSAVVDAGNTPTTTLRPGLLLAYDTTTSKLHNFDPSGANGRQIALGALVHTVVLDTGGGVADRPCSLYLSGLMRTDGVLPAATPRAWIQLSNYLQSWIRSPHLGGLLMHPKGVRRANAETVTVAVADHGMLFLCSGTTTLNLPAKIDGFTIRAVVTDDSTLVINGEGSDILGSDGASGTSTATTVTLSLTDHKISGQVLIECMYIGENVLRYVISNLGGTPLIFS